jgi:hypothetical protein
MDSSHYLGPLDARTLAIHILLGMFAYNLLQNIVVFTKLVGNDIDYLLHIVICIVTRFMSVTGI